MKIVAKLKYIQIKSGRFWWKVTAVTDCQSQKLLAIIMMVQYRTDSRSDVLTAVYQSFH